MIASSGNERADRERERRRPRGLERARGRDLGDAELVAHVRAELVVRHQLFGDEPREPGLDAAVLVDLRELAQLAAAGSRAIASASIAQVGLLGVALRAHRDVLAGGHRHRARDEPGEPGGDDGRARRCSAAATPITRPATETMPSLAPSTAARSQPDAVALVVLGARARTTDIAGARYRHWA